MNDSFDTSSIGTPPDSREQSVRRPRGHSSENSDDNRSIENGSAPMNRTEKIDIREISPPQSPKSVQEEQSALSEPKKAKHGKRRRRELDEEVVRTKVDDLLSKIEKAVKEDCDLILRKQPGRLNRSKKAKPCSGT